MDTKPLPILSPARQTPTIVAPKSPPRPPLSTSRPTSEERAMVDRLTAFFRPTNANDVI